MVMATGTGLAIKGNMKIRLKKSDSRDQTRYHNQEIRLKKSDSRNQTQEIRLKRSDSRDQTRYHNQEIRLKKSDLIPLLSYSLSPSSMAITIFNFFTSLILFSTSVMIAKPSYPNYLSTLRTYFEPQNKIYEHSQKLESMYNPTNSDLKLVLSLIVYIRYLS